MWKRTELQSERWASLCRRRLLIHITHIYTLLPKIMLIFVINLPKDSVRECWRVEERCMMESLDDHHRSKCVYVHVGQDKWLCHTLISLFFCVTVLWVRLTIIRVSIPWAYQWMSKRKLISLTHLLRQFNHFMFKENHTSTSYYAPFIYLRPWTSTSVPCLIVRSWDRPANQRARARAAGVY